MSVPYLACMALVANLYGLPPRVLPAIQAVEGGAVGLASRNANGTEDLGIMQINTVWIAPLARATGQPPGVIRTRLLHEPCFNIAAAAAILRTHLIETRGALMPAIRLYHSRAPVHALPYGERVLRAATRLFVGTRRAGQPG